MAVSYNNNNKEKILAAARALMSEKGIQKTSLADIARSVGISKGTLFYHFASKDDLINDILADHFTNLVHIAKTNLPRYLEESTPSKALQAAFEQFSNDLDITLLDLYLLQEGLQSNASIHQKFLERKRNWRQIIAEHLQVAFNITAPEHVSSLGAMILAIIDGLALQILVEPGSVNIEEVSYTLAEMLTLLSSRERHDT